MQKKIKKNIGNNCYSFSGGNGKLVLKSMTLVCGFAIATSIAGCTYIPDTTESEYNLTRMTLNDVSIETTVNNNETSNSFDMSDINTSYIPSSSDVQNTSTTESEIVYDFEWNDDYADMFNAYLENLTGYDISYFVETYGLQDNPILQEYLTDFVNETFDKNYDVVPLDQAGNIARLITSSSFHHDTVDDEYSFNNTWYYEEEYGFVTYMSSPFLNKYYFSYLVATGKPYGEMVGYSDFEQILPGNVNFEDMMNYRETYEQTLDSQFDCTSPEQLVVMLLQANASIYLVCTSDNMSDYSIANHPERAEIINGYVQQHTPGVQIGQPVTREMYIEIFGEEPYQFEYLQNDPTMTTENPSRQR